MEVIDLGLSDLEPVSIQFNEPSSNSLGAGIELLMNDKKKTPSGSMQIDLGELDKLEDALKDLSESSNTNETKTVGGLGSSFSNFFGMGSSAAPPPSSSASSEPSNNMGNDYGHSNIGQATADSMGNTKTWDGFQKINEIPQMSSSSRLSDREKRRKKRMMIKKLEEWYEKGLLKNNHHFTMESAYEEIEDEYESALEDKRKKDSIKLQGWWFMTFVNSVEYANAAFNPFDINLDGWGEQVSEDIDSYEEIFSELHDKYKGGKLAPELSLLLRLGFSAAVVNFTNKALSTATPGFNDVIRQSPELMKAFTSATVNSMSQQSPGFAFANNLMQDNKPRGPPPPAPVETKSQPPQQRPSMVYTEAPSNRQDINMARGAMFREQGVEVNNFQSANEPPSQMRSTRPDMRGPQNTDIDNILSGLKTRTVNIHEQQNTEDNDSMISISSLKEIQNNNMPKKSRRRSDKNVVSLDI
jgi:hypothetical protein